MKHRAIGLALSKLTHANNDCWGLFNTNGKGFDPYALPPQGGYAHPLG